VDTGLVPTRRIRVFIVDDHALVAESLALALGDETDLAVVGRAATGRDAIAQCRERRPDVIVLDHGLPDLDGIETARALVADHPTVGIVMLTGSGALHIQRRAGEVGCLGFVTKDRATSELVAAVRAVAEGRQMTMAPSGIPGETDLSERELQILDGIVRGLDNRAIAAELFLSVHTVRNHVQKVLAKLGAHSKLEAAATARSQGLIRAIGAN
jgi:DNA-binding NarL/FixJ family response regulator